MEDDCDGRVVDVDAVGGGIVEEGNLFARAMSLQIVCWTRSALLLSGMGRLRASEAKLKKTVVMSSISAMDTEMI